ncbi:hypothetical protein L21SP3_02272 [Sedimentisphaera cyanobacteriorum]|uniref:Uncharacterized protein n=1 Tax=Sedimentisphaera cyanobacteriorum TaxID=1940790 RepID=A0A1Q2HSU0_9BACT|nr:hypothetical protein [Sedimentisphaera cyanobacteriorum]AQQ10440.1 hypothetical protein L21SP3_02272 [Sedimentisphaera cyanobacteriorum]
MISIENYIFIRSLLPFLIISLVVVSFIAAILLKTYKKKVWRNAASKLLILSTFLVTFLLYFGSVSGKYTKIYAALEPEPENRMIAGIWENPNKKKISFFSNGSVEISEGDSILKGTWEIVKSNQENKGKTLNIYKKNDIHSRYLLYRFFEVYCLCKYEKQDDPLYFPTPDYYKTSKIKESL